MTDLTKGNNMTYIPRGTWRCASCFEINSLQVYSPPSEFTLGQAMSQIEYLEGLLGRYASEVGDANGIYFEPAGPEGQFVIDLAERARADEETLKDKPQ